MVNVSDSVGLVNFHLATTYVHDYPTTLSPPKHLIIQMLSWACAAVIFTVAFVGLLGCTQKSNGIIRENIGVTPTLTTARTPLNPDSREESETPETQKATDTKETGFTPIPLPSVADTATTGAAQSQELKTMTPYTVTPTSTITLSISRPLSNTRPLTETIIGYSYENRPITAYQFGMGTESIVLEGGIHGGYEWNTILLAYEAIDYFTGHPESVPESVTVYIVPSANPDGLYAVTGKVGRFATGDLAEDTIPGRFNGRGVDLNRNWECQWSETAVWRDQPVSPGADPFSEPESIALRDFLISLQPNAVIFYHSAAEGVYAACCPEMYAPSRQLAELYGAAAGYPVFDRFDYYDITGDAGDWLASQGIPSITVELITHQNIRWEKNRAGILEILAHYESFLLLQTQLNRQAYAGQEPESE